MRARRIPGRGAPQRRGRLRSHGTHDRHRTND